MCFTFDFASHQSLSLSFSRSLARQKSIMIMRKRRPRRIWWVHNKVFTREHIRELRNWKRRTLSQFLKTLISRCRKPTCSSSTGGHLMKHVSPQVDSFHMTQIVEGMPKACHFWWEYRNKNNVGAWKRLNTINVLSIRNPPAPNYKHIQHTNIKYRQAFSPFDLKSTETTEVQASTAWSALNCLSPSHQQINGLF